MRYRPYNLYDLNKVKINIVNVKMRSTFKIYKRNDFNTKKK